MTKMLTNKTNLAIIDSFNNTEYGDKLIAICPILKRATINVVNYQESKYLKASGFNNNDAWVCYIPERESIDSPIYAEILTNKDMIQQLNLSENEQFAAIAHEIGHIITYFRTDYKQLDDEKKEMTSDNYACRIGLTESLSSLLNKLIVSGDYSADQTQLMQKRLDMITFYNCQLCS
ncbi:MAG: hypothetical protein PUC50_07910 [Bacteroidales bacterium]|nr:hypothetical protein [Bacteroidales bacterium]